jgi:pyrroline-5-carboxylate reductase
LYNSGDFSCQEWIQKVSSKGGTTEAAMLTFENQQVKNHIIEGANAALKRAIELGNVK